MFGPIFPHPFEVVYVFARIWSNKEFAVFGFRNVFAFIPAADGVGRGIMWFYSFGYFGRDIATVASVIVGIYAYEASVMFDIVFYNAIYLDQAK